MDTENLIIQSVVLNLSSLYITCTDVTIMCPGKQFILFIFLFLHQTLHNAARRGDLEEVKLVLTKTADINNKDDNGVCMYVRLYYWQ